MEIVENVQMKHRFVLSVSEHTNWMEHSVKSNVVPTTNLIQTQFSMSVKHVMIQTVNRVKKELRFVLNVTRIIG
jgi:hypothetical protein